MFKLPRFLIRSSPVQPVMTSNTDLHRAADTQLEMGAALMFGLQRKNTRLRFVEHCARVTALVGDMARVLRLAEDERSDLCAAAQLHELGMIAVPTDLIEKPSHLDEVTIARIRQQASIGAEIVRITLGNRVSMLVETQYADFASLRARLSPNSTETLLAGLLRAADVLDTMRHPRPYQADLDPTLGPVVLREGEGTRFHPLAVESLMQLKMIRA
jgi:HD-GYP domain-containing protein (c-di-GMP phosphodiesterase class II)